MSDDQTNSLPPDLFADFTGVITLRFSPLPEGHVPPPGEPPVVYIDETDAPAVQGLEQGIATGATRNILADLRGTPFINTAKLGLLMRLRKEIVVQGGEIVVLCEPGDLDNVLRVTRLDRLLRVVRV